MSKSIQPYRLMPRLLVVSSCLTMALIIGGCGQKGDLYIPQDEQTLTTNSLKPGNSTPGKNKPAEQQN